MSNIGLIIKREYLTRVKKRSFIVTTLLVPILFVLVFGIMGIIAAKSGSDKKIAVIDQSNFFDGKLNNNNKLSFDFVQIPLDSAKKNQKALGYDGILFLQNFNINNATHFDLYSDEQLGMTTQSYIENQLNEAAEKERINQAGIAPEILDKLSQKTITLIPKVGEEEIESSNEVASGIAYVSGMILYLLMLIYGMSVMKSVMEEKTNRIAEIIVSSVKPFNLMLGKIVGVALVGLTQFIIWLLFIGISSVIILSVLGVQGLMNNPEMMDQVTAAMSQNNIDLGSKGELITKAILTANWTKIVLWFLFYFLGGYFLYASLFAAVGSLVDEENQDSNSLTMPITMPIILGFFIMITALNDPNSGLAIFGSIFPLTSPIVMMARIPFDSPTWYELLASVLCIIFGFLGTTWLAAKIYRTGILMYGKKVTLKEVGKWIVRKG